MVRVYTLLLVLLCLSAISVRSQLSTGSIVPNFTATDLNGNQWELYELLGQNKSVVLFFGITWSYDTWMYHQGGRLKQVWNTYGPPGTNEIIPIFIEVDMYTDLADLQGTGDATQGDYVTDTPYPIIDDDGTISAALGIADEVPAVYLVCPNRVARHARYLTLIQIKLAHDQCPKPVAGLNAALVDFLGVPVEFCKELALSPAIRLQNLGLPLLQQVGVQLTLDGISVDTLFWSGSLESFEMDTLVFDQFIFNQTQELQARIFEVNSQADNPADNELQQTTSKGANTQSNLVKLMVKTDDYPVETYWELAGENGSILYWGGNITYSTGQVSPSAYTEPNTVYQHDLLLPSDGCYTLTFYDTYANGMCCGFGQGFYRLLDEYGFILLQGGLFKDREERPFSLEGGANFSNNASITAQLNTIGDVCGTTAFTPVLEVQNLGSNTIEQIVLDVYVNNLPVGQYTLETYLDMGEKDTLELPELTIHPPAVLRFEISHVNGQPDSYPYLNTLSIPLLNRKTQTPALVLDMLTDEWAYEIYWELTNSAGEVLANGGNLHVASNGGGQQTAQPSDPGAYTPFANVLDTIWLPDDITDCLTFRFIDDWGDGIAWPGYLRIRDLSGTTLVNSRPVAVRDSFIIEAEFGPSSTSEELQQMPLISVWPNPVRDVLQLDLRPGKENHVLPLKLQLLDVAGRLWQEKTLLTTGSIRWHLPDLPAGIYLLRVSGNKVKPVTHRIVVIE